VSSTAIDRDCSVSASIIYSKSISMSGREELVMTAEHINLSISQFREAGKSTKFCGG
jgi:hypothetical protein